MMTTLFSNHTLKINKEVSSDQQSQKSVSNTINKKRAMFCQEHSSKDNIQEVKYINLSFVSKRKPNFHQTFLCEICFTQFKRKNSDQSELNKIKTLKDFSKKYIESILNKYNQVSERPINETQNILQKAEFLFCNQIDTLNQNFTRCCQIYKDRIKDIFQTLRNPWDANEVKKFLEGKMNEGMIQGFCKNYSIVNRFTSLIGKQNQNVVERSFEGVKYSFEQIQKSFTQNMNNSLKMFKLYVQRYDQQKQQSETKLNKMIPQSQEKKQVINKNQQRNVQYKNSFKIQQKKQNQQLVSKSSRQIKQNDIRMRKKQEVQKRNRRMRDESSVSSSSSSSSDDSSSDQSSNENEKRHKRSNHGDKRRHINEKKDKNSRDHLQHHLIHKEKKEKPARLTNVVMIDEQYVKNSRNILALYVVRKAHSVRTGVDRVYRMQIQQFKRRYADSFRKYLYYREKGK